MKRLLFLFLPAWLLIAPACQKDIDFEYHEIDPITVIEANLNTTSVSVIITETTPVDEPMNRTRYTDAEVVLTDLSTGSASALAPDDDGVYTDGKAGIPGHCYRLDVRRGAESFSSTCDMLMPAVIVDFQFIRIETPMVKAVAAQVAFVDPPDTRGDCFIVSFFRNGILFSRGTISDIQTTSAGILIASCMAEAAGDIPEGVDYSDDADRVLEDGDIMTATVTPVSRAYYDYIVALNSGSNGPLMFSGDFCLGYFLAAPESSISRTFIYSEL